MSPAPYVYVASSWRCARQPVVVEAFRQAGVGVYDFRNPPKRSGFGWEQVMDSYDGSDRVAVGDYLAALDHPTARAGFAADFGAMRRATHCVLVLPCNRSAHLELGWFVGRGRPTAVLLDGPAVVPELMYLMCDLVTPSLIEVVSWVTADSLSEVDRPTAGDPGWCPSCGVAILGVGAAECSHCGRRLAATEVSAY